MRGVRSTVLFGLAGASSVLVVALGQEKEARGNEGSGPTFYGSRLSPFCGVIESFLRFERLPHTHVEVEVLKKAQLEKFGTNVMPLWERADGSFVVKAQEIIDAIQSDHPRGGRLDPFTDAQKNQCMLINAHVVPLLALCRHLTYASSKETVAYFDQHVNEWGRWRTWYAKMMVPIFYWQRWRKMGFRVLVETGYEDCASSPTTALFRELEKVQEHRGEADFYGGRDKINVVDIWLFGILSVMKDETLYKRMESNCPKTTEWIHRVESRM